MSITYCFTEQRWMFVQYESLKAASSQELISETGARLRGLQKISQLIKTKTYDIEQLYKLIDSLGSTANKISSDAKAEEAKGSTIMKYKP